MDFCIPSEPPEWSLERRDYPVAEPERRDYPVAEPLDVDTDGWIVLGFELDEERLAVTCI